MSKLIIAFSGAQSTGKTTLLTELKKDPKLSSTFFFIENITRELLKVNLPLGQEGTVQSQNFLIQKHREILHNTDPTIVDRSTLDVLVYTDYLHRHQKLTIDQALPLMAECRDLLSLYALIFYIKPEFPIVADGVRSTSVDFRDEIASLFEEHIEEARRRTDVVQLSGSLNNRLERIHKEFTKRGIEHVN